MSSLNSENSIFAKWLVLWDVRRFSIFLKGVKKNVIDNWIRKFNNIPNMTQISVFQINLVYKHDYKLIFSISTWLMTSQCNWYFCSMILKRVIVKQSHVLSIVPSTDLSESMSNNTSRFTSIYSQFTLGWSNIQAQYFFAF